MKNRISKKRRKSRQKGLILMYDLATKPNGKTMQEVINDFNKGFVFWDSSAAVNCGQKHNNNMPKIINGKHIQIIDLNDSFEMKDNN